MQGDNDRPELLAAKVYHKPLGATHFWHNGNLVTLAYPLTV